MVQHCREKGAYQNATPIVLFSKSRKKTWNPAEPAPVLRILHHIIRFYEKKTFIRNMQTSVAQFTNPNSWKDEVSLCNTAGDCARCPCGKLLSVAYLLRSKTISNEAEFANVQFSYIVF